MKFSHSLTSKACRVGLLSALTLFSVPAFAQGYSATVGDLNTVFDPPMNIQGIICGAYTDPLQISVCKDGSAAARSMAEKYAKNSGAFLGCIDGLSQGLNAGFLAGQNPTAEMLNYAKTFTAGSTQTSAVERAKAQAKGEGQTVSADQIISRYRAVIGKRDASGRPVLPNKNFELPALTFNGYDDGYDFDFYRNDQNLASVYQAGWVNASSPWNDRVAAGKLYSMQGSYEAQMCRMDGTVFGRRQLPIYTIWDYFRARGKMNFEAYGWNNSDWAWDVLINDEKTLDSYVTYTGIEKQTKMVTSQVPIKETRPKLDSTGKAIPALDANGKQVVDAYGRPVFQTEEVVTGYQNVTQTVPLSETEKQALRNAYLVGFKESYQRYYARQYASQNYYSTAMDKYKSGMEIGKLLGAEVAQKTALKNAYDAAYKTASAAAYAYEAKENYMRSFKYLIDIFEKNPVLELNSAKVLGQTDDGIFRAGEELKLQFTATNLGEVSRPSMFSILGGESVIPAPTGFSFSVPSLASADFMTGTLGKVGDNVLAGRTLGMTVGLQNPGDLKEVARSLIVQKDQQVLINDYLEVKRAIPTLDYLAGTMNAKIDVMNPANLSAPITVSKVEVNLGVAGAKQSDVIQLPGGGISNLSLTVEAIDPMGIIQAGGLSGTVNTYVAGRLAHQVPISARVSESQIMAYLRYFDALATRKSTNSGSVALNDRASALISILDEQNKQDVAQNLVWDKDSEIRNTMIVAIQGVYNESKRAGRIDAAAQKFYNDLGATMAAHSGDVKAGGGLRLNRNANRNKYLNQIRQFAQI